MRLRRLPRSFACTSLRLFEHDRLADQSVTATPEASTPWLGAINWLDLTVHGTEAAYDELTSPNLCARCLPGARSLQHKRIETLVY
jgi:hypothetical protein